MKKFATLAAATAIVAAASAPVAANETNADPFVSSQGSATVSAGAVAAGIAVAVIAIASIDSSDDT